MASLEDIRRRLAEQENKRNQSNKNDGEGPVYPHWNINEGDTAIVRFLEDGNPNNPYFWVERLMFKFPFNGVVGDPQAGKQIVQVPCMEMYGEKDAVLDEVRTWFKDPSMEDMGRAYWKKRSYIFQGFVRQDPLNQGDNAPENPIRRFMISPQIFNLIKSSLMDPEIENLPTDPIAGLDFRITKASKGGYADYSSSSWARKETSLTEDEAAAIEKYGLSDLATFLPTKPTEEVQKVIREMFEASVNGEPYDPAKWGAYFTPPGMARTGDNNSSSSTSTSSTTTEAKEAAPAAEEKPAAQENVATPAAEEKESVAEEKPTTVEEPSGAADEDKDAKTKRILEMIKNRQQ